MAMSLSRLPGNAVAFGCGAQPGIQHVPDSPFPNRLLLGYGRYALKLIQRMVAGIGTGMFMLQLGGCSITDLFGGIMGG